MFPTPILIINFKTYKEGVGKNAENLAVLCDTISQSTQKRVAIAVSPASVFRVSSLTTIPILSQHLDPDEPGSHTGRIIAEDLKDNDAAGVIINHAEDQVPLEVIERVIERARQVGLISVVCANTEDMAEKIAALHPDCIAIEPPELIGGNVSVSSAKPEIVTNTIARVQKVADIPVLCGAGVRTKEDVAKALELGAAGILLASGVVLAKKPDDVLYALLSAFPSTDLS